MTRYAYVGTYTASGREKTHRKEGIFVYHLNPADGRLTLSSAAESGMNPSFLTIHPNRKFLYAANELTEGEVSAFSINPINGSLTRLNAQSAAGMHTCYVSVDPSGKYLLAANYSSGSVAIFPILPDGELAPKSDFVQHSGVLGPNKGRQERAHAHSIDFDPSGKFVLAADLGLDKVFVYRLEPQNGKLAVHEPVIQANPGAGPRHFIFHPNGRFLYVANELNSTVTAYEWDANQGTAEMLSSLSTLPEGFSKENIVADIHFDGSGRYLVVSNRGHHSLAIFEVEPDSGSMIALSHVPSGGEWPRNFGFDPSGANLLTANQNSDNLASFRFDRETGELTATGQVVKVPAPVCVKFLDL